MYTLIRNLLFALPPETSHHLALAGISVLEKTRLSHRLAPPPPETAVEVMGLHFPNPVGLAAGLDKNGEHIDGLAALGFGFIEVGTVTPRPQPGNPKPRLFRIPQAEALINRMGFNNKGVDYLVEQVGSARYNGVLGINIGKNKDTPAEQAADDYLLCMRRVYSLASYITVNLSSPNTPGLRELQFGEPLVDLISQLKAEQAKLAGEHGRYVPLLVKLAPDMLAEDIEQVAKVLQEQAVEGIIATNTTIDREPVKFLPHNEELGGLSGAPLREKSTEVIRRLRSAVGEAMPIIGVGGITDGASAAEKIEAGASLVQIYTGFIYRGPDLIGEAAEAAAPGAERPAPGYNRS